jgi:hypothetical protein
MVSELLESPEYDTEVKVYGQVSLLGEMLCPCFELTSGGKTVLVWYGLMVEDDGTERPAVSMGDILPHKCGIDLFGVIHAAKHSLLMTDYLRPTSEGVTHNQDRQEVVLIQHTSFSIAVVHYFRSNSVLSKPYTSRSQRRPPL